MIRKEFTCTRDDLKIRGTVYRPEGGPLPIAVVSHGFMANRKSTKDYAKMLAEEGYAAFCFDFCGGCVKGQSEGATTDMTVFTEAEDLKAVIRFAREQEYTDSEAPLVLMGCSQGGFVSGIVSAELKEQVGKLILFYPALCIPDDARRGQMIMAKFDPENIPETVKCGPMLLGRCYPESVIDKDPNELLKAYEGEVLIVHGNADSLVDISYSRSAAKAYKNCTIKEIARGEHGFRKEIDELAVFYVKEFLKGYQEVLTVSVYLTDRIIEKKKKGYTLTLPFVGTAESSFFTGAIMPHAADVQEKKGRKLLHACADYVLKGTDCSGTDCTVHVVNTNDGKAWKPVIETDSEALSFLNGADCDVMLEGRKEGPIVHIFAKA